jgi:hypothetical protein
VLNNNFHVVELVALHMKTGEFGLSICSVRRTELECDGTVTEISAGVHLAAGVDWRRDSRSVPDGARRASFCRDICGWGKIAIMARECPDRHVAASLCGHTWPPAPLSSVDPRHR